MNIAREFLEMIDPGGWNPWKDAQSDYMPMANTSLQGKSRDTTGHKAKNGELPISDVQKRYIKKENPEDSKQKDREKYPQTITRR